MSTEEANSAGSKAAALSGHAVGSNDLATNVGIEKLKGRENYVSWAFAVKMILCRERCWDTVTATDDKAVDKDMD